MFKLLFKALVAVALGAAIGFAVALLLPRKRIHHS